MCVRIRHGSLTLTRRIVSSSRTIHRPQRTLPPTRRLTHPPILPPTQQRTRRPTHLRILRRLLIHPRIRRLPPTHRRIHRLPPTHRRTRRPTHPPIHRHPHPISAG